ncbi:sensor histidine kinase [Streptomyces avermitilis]|uniref:sensor histidine kinase n=1 Tax=Streptomyces avermitilis TaxID=33903 RepID=UPI0033BC9E70
MEEERANAPGWRHGPPWWHRWVDDRRQGRGRGSRLLWRSTALLTVLVLVGSDFAAHVQEGGRAPLDPFARALLLLGSALLLWRQRHPVLVVFGTAAAAMLYLGAGYAYGPVFLTVAVGCFSAVVAGHRRAAWTAVGMLWAGHVVVSHWLYRWLPPSGDVPAPWGQEIVVVTWVVAIMAVSELARLRREQWARERAERAQAARRRADEERLRIARELHDVLAHSISVINVQAGVGLALLDSDPEQARTALTIIKAAGKEALGEVRHVLDTLRTPDEAPRAPAPGLDRLSELVEQAANAGLTVEIEGEAPKLAPGTDLAAFRIVQEALTNVVRHSGSRHARVLIDDGRGDTGGDVPDDARAGPRIDPHGSTRGGTQGVLRLRIDDDGPAAGVDAGGSGNGLAGMRERAAALGGTIEAGPRADGGFRVLAVLPFRAPPEETLEAEEVR